MDALNEAEIRQYIDALDTMIDVHLLETIDSTNRFLKHQPSNEMIQVCCSETQTQGRGRFGRAWHSPFGENIYFSARYRLHCDLGALSGLSLVSSLAVIHTLQELGFSDDLLIKWPNDILWQGRKLSGCLIELMTNDDAVDVILGIGINVNSNTQDHSLPDKPWCSLFDIVGKRQNRNHIIGRLITHLYLHTQRLITLGLTSFLKQWGEVDALYGQLITVSTQGTHITGQANGIDDTGRLVLIDDHHETHYLSSGETSVSESLRFRDT